MKLKKFWSVGGARAGCAPLNPPLLYMCQGYNFQGGIPIGAPVHSVGITAMQILDLTCIQEIFMNNVRRRRCGGLAPSAQTGEMDHVQQTATARSPSWIQHGGNQQDYDSDKKSGRANISGWYL